MKILITSDVHGKKSLLEEVIKKHPNMYHLNAGDIGLSESYLDEQNILSVKGNTDFFSKSGFASYKYMVLIVIKYYSRKELICF